MITDTKLLIFSLNAILFAFFLMANGIFSQIRSLRLSYWSETPAMAPARIKTQKKQA